MSESMDVDTGEEAPRYPTLPMIDEDAEWMYPMRRSMQEIIPGLFLGPYAVACRSKLADMKAAGITHVVCVRATVEAHLIRPNHPEHFRYLVMDMDDSAMELIIPKVKIAVEFIDDCFKSNGKVLVHGNAGMARSATLVVGYIMSKFGVSFNKACKFVQSKRFCICIKESFAYQLKEYQPIYMAMHSTTSSMPGFTVPQYQSLKRRIDEIQEDEQEDESGAARPRLDRINMDVN